MLKNKLKRVFLLILLISLTIVVLINNSVLAAEEKYDLVLFSAAETGQTYPSMCTLSLLMSENKPEIWRSISVIPSTGPFAGMRAFATGEADITYSNAMQLFQLYNNEGNFASNPIPDDKKALLGPCLWTDVNIIFTLASRDDIKTMQDLEGKTVNFGVPGTNMHTISSLIVDCLGIECTRTNLDTGSVGDALIDGAIDAYVGYASSGVFIGAWAKELEMRTDLKYITLSKEEVNKVVEEIEPLGHWALERSWFTDRIEGPEKFDVPVLGIYWIFSPDLPEQAAYEIAEGLYVAREEIGEARPEHWVWAEQPLELQKTHLGVASGTMGFPIHPGFARWLKDMDIWNDEWVVGKATR